MADDNSSFWTPARIAAVIGIVLLVVLLAYAASLPQNKYHPGDLLEPDTVEEARL